MLLLLFYKNQNWGKSSGDGDGDNLKRMCLVTAQLLMDNK